MDNTGSPKTHFSGSVANLTAKISVEDKLSQEYYDAVIEKVFKPSWYVLGNLNDIPTPGRFFVYDVPTFNMSVLVVRTEQGVNAFHNVCRHRGKKVVQTKCGWAQGNAGVFTCWFHGWAYGKDGALLNVPDEMAFRDFDKSKYGLVPIKVEVWSGLILAYFGDGEPQPLKEWLGELYEGFEDYYTRMERIATFSADVKSNWNWAMDSFSEGYHTVFLHRNTQPELTGKKNPKRHAPIIDLYGHTVRTSGVANPDYVGPPAERALYKHGRKLSPAVETDYSELPPGVNRTRYTPWFFDVVWLFPNFAILNGPHWVSTLMIWPIDKDHSRVITDHYARKARHAGDRLAQAYMRGLLVSVTREDLSAMEDVQYGLSSGALKHIHVSQQEIVLQKRYAFLEEMIKP
jgi:phenylpropionate dioxygenase-like ring-hydroxylating dioxygenase large terminal subunit